MKVIKLGTSAQSRIAQAWYFALLPAVRTGADSVTATAAGPRRFAAMAFDRKNDR
jgi:hypothetical protein